MQSCHMVFKGNCQFNLRDCPNIWSRCRLNIKLSRISPKLWLSYKCMYWCLQYVQSLHIWILQVNLSDVALIDRHLNRLTKWKEEADMKDTKKIPLEYLPRFLTLLKNQIGDSGICCHFWLPLSLRRPIAIGIRSSLCDAILHFNFILKTTGPIVPHFGVKHL